MAKLSRVGDFGIPLDASLRSYDSGAVSDYTAKDTGSESLVQQHFADEVDINTIVRRFGLTRDLPPGLPGAVYGDFTGITDYASALEMIDRAQESFMQLPPALRERFDNDPGKLIAYAQSVSEEEFLRSTAPVTETAPLVPPTPGGVEPPPVSDS